MSDALSLTLPRPGSLSRLRRIKPPSKRKLYVWLQAAGCLGWCLKDLVALMVGKVGGYEWVFTVMWLTNYLLWRRDWKLQPNRPVKRWEWMWVVVLWLVLTLGWLELLS